MATILLVEDEPLVAKDLEKVLDRLGYEVAGTAGSGSDALRSAESLRPDLVLLSVDRGGALDGVATAAALRDQLNIPVVFLTAYADETCRGRSQDAFPHVRKPYDEREMKSTLEIALFKHRAETRIRARGQEVAQAAREIDAMLTAAQAKIRTAGRQEEGVAGLLEEAGEQIERARVSVGRLGTAEPSSDRKKVEPSLASPSAERKAGERQRILVVDDEQLLLSLMKRVLSGEHEVTTVDRGRAALERIASGERYELVLCDLTMPDMNGMDLYESVRKLSPDQAERFAFMCGGSVNRAVSEFLRTHSARRLDKPMSLDQLRRFVGDFLRAREGRSSSAMAH